MELGRELSRTISQVNRQIDIVTKGAEDMRISPYDLRDAHGNFIMVPLLGAKAQLLHALALINQKDR